MSDFERLERPEQFAMHRKGVINTGLYNLEHGVSVAFGSFNQEPEAQPTEAIDMAEYISPATVTNLNAYRQAKEALISQPQQSSEVQTAMQAVDDAFILPTEVQERGDHGSAQAA